MNDDPIKLREALYAAEPFLTYLYKEATMERNNKPLEQALNKVRGALDMDPVKLSQSKVDVSKLENDRIELVSFTENEDVSASATFDLHGDTPKLLMRIGLSKILHEAARMHGEDPDETGE